MSDIAFFHFRGCLNDFLSAENRNHAINYHFCGNPGIKDPIEALGIPHSEVTSILVNGRSVDFKYQLQANDQVIVSAEPDGSSSIDTSMPTAFVVDVNLGKLARYLRLLGFDTAWRNNLNDREIVNISVHDQRIILTRDRRLLFHREIQYGYWVRAVQPDLQVPEVLKRLDLWQQIEPFHRCAICNGLIQVVAKAQVLNKLEPLTRKYYDKFYQCSDCGQIYWKGSHYHKLLNKIEAFKDHA